MAEAAIQRWKRREAGTSECTLFGSVLRPGTQGAGHGRLAGAALLVIALHVLALLVLGTSTPKGIGQAMVTGSGGEAAEVAVRFMAPRAPAASSSSAREQPTSRPPSVRRRVPRPSPVSAAPTPPVESPMAPAPVEETVAVEAPEAVAEAAGTEVAAGGTAGGSVSGASGGGLAGGGIEGAGGLLPPPPPPALTVEQRRSLTSRYLQELFRSRLAARFQYPPEAEQLGLEGLVTLRVSIDRTGQLLGARVQGRCPHPLLCDAALRTVRESVPFPPPPAELGGSIAVDVPFQYRLE